VQTGIQKDGWVEILAGLQPGERIVADGTNRVRPNDPVSVAGAGQRTRAAATSQLNAG